MNAKSQAGSSLIEVMVALFVLAIGLLGVLAMQSKSMQYNQSANTYAQAVYIANDIVERIRSNIAEQNTYAAWSGSNAVTGDPGATINTACTAAACTSAQIVVRDKAKLRENIFRWLPGGKAEIFPLSNPLNDGRNFIRVIVSFDDSRSNSAPAAGVAAATTTLNYTLIMGL